MNAPRSYENKIELVTADFAVREAMTYALSKQLLPFERRRNEGIEEYLIRKSKDGCLTSSQRTISYLHSKYPELFDRYFLLSGLGVPDRRPFVDNSWGSYTHTLFLVRSTGDDPCFFVGSPANFSGNEDDSILDMGGERKLSILTSGGSLQEDVARTANNNRLSMILKGHSVSQILGEIGHYVGGEWCGPDELQSAIDDDNFHLYIYKTANLYSGN